MTQTTDQRIAMNWLLGNDTGMSSTAILARMLGATPQEMFAPSDPADLGRCIRLLDLIPDWRLRLSEMKDCGCYWAALVNRWDELETLMRDEVGSGWERGRSAPRTYELMKNIQIQARSVKDAWTSGNDGK